MSSDAIVILKEEHKQIRRLFREFQSTGEDDHDTRAELMDQILTALTVHTYIENEVMYPQVRQLLPELESDVLESYEEHHVVDMLALELAEMGPRDERFEAKATVLIENVTHHMEEEEGDWFPRVREGLGRKQLQEIGASMQQLRPEAPTRPSPQP